MADVTFTPANVVAGAASVQEDGLAGATITAGQLVYKDAATGKYLIADADGAAAAGKSPRGFALHGASNNQPLKIHRSGEIDFGGGLTAGIPYFLSSNPGAFCPLADVGVGEDYVFVGIAKSTTKLDVGIKASGVSA